MKMRTLKWHKVSDELPQVPGRYLVTLRRPSGGHWVMIRRWTGVNWDQGTEVTAWMEMPNAYGGVDRVHS